MKAAAGVVVRPGTELDLDAILTLQGEIEEAPQWSARTWAEVVGEALSGPGSLPVRTRRAFVAAGGDADGTPGSHPRLIGFAVGSLVMRAESDDALGAELESIAVSDGARRRGAGRALCGAVAEWAHVYGAPWLDLEVRSQDAVARAFYESLGFAATGVRRRYYKNPEDDAILMRLPLSLGR